MLIEAGPLEPYLVHRKPCTTDTFYSCVLGSGDTSGFSHRIRPVVPLAAFPP